MKLAVDITPILYNRGVSRYTSNLVRTFMNKSGLEITLFGSSLRQKTKLEKIAKQLVQQADNPSQHHSTLYPLPPSLLSTLWYQINIPSIEHIVGKQDVYHAWEELVPPTQSTPVVATIHDLAMLRYPKTAHPKTLYKHKQAWKRLREYESEIIAVSKATRDDIIELLGIPKQKIHVVYEALPEESKKEIRNSDIEYIKKKYKRNKPFLFFVGTTEPRKNLKRLIKAWEPLAREVDLVIAGSQGWDKEIQSYKARNLQDIYFLGFVPNQDLACLYTAAEVFVFPSLYEGFGLPVLESFYYKTPVVTSDRSSLPEIGGNAVELVDPENVESIRNGIQKVLDESDENRKQRLQRMKLRLQLFTWEQTAQKTIEVYKKAL